MKYDTLRRKHEAEEATIRRRQEEEVCAVAQQEIDKLDVERASVLDMAKSLGMYDIVALFDDEVDDANVISDFKNLQPSVKSEVNVKIEGRPNNLPFVSPTSAHFLTELSGLASTSNDFHAKVLEDINFMKSYLLQNKK